METAEYLWQKMWQCRRLANASPDDLTAGRLMDLATEYETRAKAVEAFNHPTDAPDHVAAE